MNRIGKIFGVALLGAALVLGAMGINSQAQADDVKIGIFSVNYNSPTIFRMIQQAKADAEALGVTILAGTDLAIPHGAIAHET